MTPLLRLVTERCAPLVDPPRRVRIIAWGEADAAERVAAMKASGEITDRDHVFIRVIRWPGPGGDIPPAVSQHSHEADAVAPILDERAAKLAALRRELAELEARKRSETGP